MYVRAVCAHANLAKGSPFSLKQFSGCWTWSVTRCLVTIVTCNYFEAFMAEVAGACMSSNDVTSFRYVAL